MYYLYVLFICIIDIFIAHFFICYVHNVVGPMPQSYLPWGMAFTIASSEAQLEVAASSDGVRQPQQIRHDPMRFQIGYIISTVPSGI